MTELGEDVSTAGMLIVVDAAGIIDGPLTVESGVRAMGALGRPVAAAAVEAGADGPLTVGARVRAIGAR